jgi:hypothetical protein
MRSIAPLAVLVLSVLFANASPAQKSTDHVGRHPAFDGREGGETIATAIEVTLPFQDTGATCDNVDDYDEVCPYTGSTAPDVVYTFVPDYDMIIGIDLQGSSYDTKLYVYDEDLVLVACNDDFYPDYVSAIEGLDVYGGARYYVVIDGYADDCGEYVVTTCEELPCIIECFDGDLLEGEPELVDGYVDGYNAGCDVDPPLFQELLPLAGQTTVRLCGQTGYFQMGGEWARDADWHQVTAGGTSLEIYFQGSYGWPTRLDVMFLDGCQNISLDPYQVGACGEAVLSVATQPGQVVTLRVRPLHPYPWPCGEYVDKYRLVVDGVAGTVATERRSWSELKQMYD